MIVQILCIDENMQFAPLAPENLAEMLERKDARVWVDLQDVEQGELEEWLEKLNIGDLSRRLCIEARDRPGFYPLTEELFLVVPVLVEAEGGRDRDYVALFCRENLLFTVHRKPLLTSRQRAEIQESKLWLEGRSIARLVSALMIDLSQECLRHASDARSGILALDERMEREPDAVEADEIIETRSELLTLAAVVSDQLPSVLALSATDKSFFKLKDAQEYMSCAVVNLQAANASLGRLDKRIEAIRSGFQMHAQDKTNRRLGMLTILSAIFMPITLLAGIWGMNFETMPELKYTFSYPVALGIMAALGSGMYLYFRKRGWF